MTGAKLRALFTAGLTYDEIAEINERSEGWKPSRAAVKRKYEAMGMPPRRASHTDLIPWRLQPEHGNDLFRHMLQAESRSRKHEKVSNTDRKLIGRLHELLFGRGKLMVVDYHPDVGFVLRERDDEDDDIIRRPRTDHYSDPGIAQGRAAGHPSRGRLRGGPVVRDDAADPQTQPSGTR